MKRCAVCTSNYGETELHCPFCGSSVYSTDGGFTGYYWSFIPKDTGTISTSNPRLFFHTPLAWCINSFDGGHAFTSGSDICKLCGMTRSEAEKEKPLPTLPTGLKSGCTCGAEKTYGIDSPGHSSWCDKEKK